MDNKINRNTIYNIIRNISGLIYPLITFPYISRVLGPEYIGKINFSTSVVNYFSLIAGLGIYTYGVRECAKVRENREKLDNIASQLLTLNIISTIITYIALVIIVNALSQFTSYKIIIYILASNIIFTTFSADWINTAFEDFKYITIRTIVCQIVTMVLLFSTVRTRESYIFYAVTLVIAQSGANIINIVYRRKFCTARIRISNEICRHIPSVMMLFSMNLFQSIFVNTDLTILGFVRGDYEVGLYGTAAKITRMVDLAIASLVWVVLPQMTEFFSERNYKKMNTLLRYSLNMIFVLGIPSIVGMVAISKELIICFAGSEYISASAPLRILAIGTFFSLVGGFVGNIILLPAGRESVLLKSSILSAIVNLVLNLILIPLYGQIAAAFTTLISYLVGFLYELKFVDKNIHIGNIINFLKAPLIESILIIMVSITLRYTTKNVYLITIGSIGISIISYIIILFCLKDKFFMNYYLPIKNKVTNLIKKGK